MPLTHDEVLALYHNGGHHYDVPMDKCITCHCMVAVGSLRQHAERCQILDSVVRREQKQIAEDTERTAWAEGELAKLNAKRNQG